MDSSRSQEAPPVDDAVVYVEELASADDYWLSITDAARVCRVQDVSIRRAINHKRLPVRRQRVGQNKRTRFVRASDLTLAGFPIIDESAMITTEIGKVDVLSIPRQQQQIAQDHQLLMLRLSEMQAELASYQQRIEEEFNQHQERFQAALRSTQEEQAQQLVEIKTTMTQEQEKFQHALIKTEQLLGAEQQMLRASLEQERREAFSRDEHVQSAMQGLRQDLTQERTTTLARDERLQVATNTLQTTFHEQQENVQRQLLHLVAAQQDHQQVVGTTIQRVEQETQESLVAIEQRVTANIKQLEQTFNSQLSELGKNLAQLQQSTEDVRQSTAVRDQDYERALRQMQAQMNQYEQLLPLLPYVQQRLVSEQDIAAWAQTLVELETRLRADQQRALEHYQPLLALLSPERLEVLTHLLENGTTSGERISGLEMSQ